MTQEPNASSSSEFFEEAVEPTKVTDDEETQRTEDEERGQPPQEEADEVEDPQPIETVTNTRTEADDTEEANQPPKRKRVVSKDLAWLQKTNAHLLEESKTTTRASKRVKTSKKPEAQVEDQHDDGKYSAKQSSETTKDSLESNIVVKPRPQRKASKPIRAVTADVDSDLEEVTSYVDDKSDAESVQEEHLKSNIVVKPRPQRKASKPMRAVTADVDADLEEDTSHANDKSDAESENVPEEHPKKVTKPEAALTRSPRSKLLSDFKSRTSKAQYTSKATEQEDHEKTEENIAFTDKKGRPKRTSIKTQKAREGFPKIS